MESLTLIETAELAERIGVDWAEVPFDNAQFRAAVEHELAESACRSGPPDELACARLALARLRERPDACRSERPWQPDGERDEPPAAI